MLQMRKQHKTNESLLQIQEIINQKSYPLPVRVKFSRYKQNQISKKGLLTP